MRNKSVSASLQKTYDECYLVCSTAVYFESQGNEAEALRSWRTALDQIYYHNAYRVPANYVPKSETDKALKDSLRDMEMQCKERVDLLEALRASRLEKATTEMSMEPSNGKIQKQTPRKSSDTNRENNERGFIGGGSIPAINYAGISKPPPLPQRPGLTAKHSSEIAVVGSKSPSYPNYMSPREGMGSSSGMLAPPTKKPSRSPSPDRSRKMLHTLRSSDRPGKKPSPKRSTTSGSRIENTVTNKAATLAWQALGKGNKDKVGRSLDKDVNTSSATLPDLSRKDSIGDPALGRTGSNNVRYDSKTRSLVPDHRKPPSPKDLLTGDPELFRATRRSNGYPFPPTDPGQPGAVSGSMLKPSAVHDLIDLEPPSAPESSAPRRRRTPPAPPTRPKPPPKLEAVHYPAYLEEYPETTAKRTKAEGEMLRNAAAKEATQNRSPPTASRKLVPPAAPPSRLRDRREESRPTERTGAKKVKKEDASSYSMDDDTVSSSDKASGTEKKRRQKQRESPILEDPVTPTSDDDSDEEESDHGNRAWEEKVAYLMKNLPKGVDPTAAKQIFNEIVVHGDEVHWDDVAGLDIAKNALKEAVVYPFLRPDLFMGLREPARGMLLFGPPGTGKTMLARAVATESKSTFFSISASSLTSKYLGESEKLVRALFTLAKSLAPSIIFVDEIDSLLSSRSGSGEHEATRRIKTEFLIQWSDLQRAAAGREQTEKEKEKGDPSRVLVLAATNLPWAIDEAARRRFVRRQYIPLPEGETRATQLRTLLGHQKHSLNADDIQTLVELTDGFSGSDITALAKDAAMGPLRSLGEALLHMSMDQIRPIQFKDFQASLINIRPSVSKQGLKQFEDWAKEFGERGG
ncbi:putative SAP1-member of the AAA-protein family [Venustampulla echinocandica]|uniref:Putative SAP1-member of the AAA-protein family n=1 Tax=Venustampulla echinocandica TaxID=2656787 RepID=A0A370TC93_9HELO|nr:putative SAP1-member of the AAA-protein family [Venustampulla echinocandica]RDL31846.1 putative SAP1-member of the AAA-protein family [Venustampulla echinocandica]